MQATYSETSKDDLSNAKDVNTWYALEHFFKANTARNARRDR